jgi:beta-lactamase regulating signal transducer with metallopeptidase domain
MSAVIDMLNRYSADWTALVVAVVWQTTLLALAIGVIAYFLRSSSPAVRYWLWQIVAIKLLLMPFWIWWVPLPWSFAPVQTVAVLPADAIAEPAPAEIQTPKHAPRAFGGWQLGDLRWQSWLLVAWGAVVLAQFARLAVQWRRLARLLRDSAPAGEDLCAKVAQVAAKLRLARVPTVRLTTVDCSPFVCRALRPTLVLPRDLLATLSPVELTQVLAHELAHVKRRDLVWGWTVELARVFYFFHPVAHWVGYRVQLERELACDQLAMAASGRGPAEYADTLVRVVSAISQPSIFRVSASAGLDGGEPIAPGDLNS